VHQFFQNHLDEIFKSTKQKYSTKSKNIAKKVPKVSRAAHTSTKSARFSATTLEFCSATQNYYTNIKLLAGPLKTACWSKVLYAASKICNLTRRPDQPISMQCHGLGAI
jgi:organic radical activating enzyme